MAYFFFVQGERFKLFFNSSNMYIYMIICLNRLTSSLAGSSCKKSWSDIYKKWRLDLHPPQIPPIDKKKGSNHQISNQFVVMG